MKHIQHYLRVYAQILKMTMSLVTEYRLNVIVQGLFAVVYLCGLYVLIQVIFSKTTMLGGWTKKEVELMFGVYIFLWGLVEFLFFYALRQFTMTGIRMGEVDKFLTKPISAQFLISFSNPFPAVLLQQIVAICIFLWKAWQLHEQITLGSILLFIIFGIFSITVVYFVDSIYSTLTFHMTESSELLKMVQTLTDNSQYPIGIYPHLIQPILFSAIPIAFMSYVPASFLLGKGSWSLAAITIMMIPVVILINRFAWQQGWKRYTSASS